MLTAQKHYGIFNIAKNWKKEMGKELEGGREGGKKYIQCFSDPSSYFQNTGSRNPRAGSAIFNCKIIKHHLG